MSQFNDHGQKNKHNIKALGQLVKLVDAYQFAEYCIARRLETRSSNYFPSSHRSGVTF